MVTSPNKLTHSTPVTLLIGTPLLNAGGGEGEGADPSESVMGDETDAFEVPGGVNGAK